PRRHLVEQFPYLPGYLGVRCQVNAEQVTPADHAYDLAVLVDDRQQLDVMAAHDSRSARDGVVGVDSDSRGGHQMLGGKPVVPAAVSSVNRRSGPALPLACVLIPGHDEVAFGDHTGDVPAEAQHGHAVDLMLD